MSNSNKSPGRPVGSADRYPRKPTVKFDYRRKRNFLKHLETHGSISAAAAHVKVSRKTVYNYMDRDPKFADQVDMAKERAFGELESYAYKRVLDGETTVVEDGEGNIISKTHKPAAAALVARMLEATDTYAKNKPENHLHLHGDKNDSAIQKLAQALGVNLPEPEKVIEGEVVEDKEEVS